MRHRDDYEISSGNVFEDLGLADAKELGVKADLAIKISEAIRRKGWTQARAASVLGLDQPKVSALTRGHLEKFSVERLCELLTRVGYNVTIMPTRKRGSGPGRFTVAAARGAH